MRLCFNIQLPDKDVRVGVSNLLQRSPRGYTNRQYKRFFPLVLCLETLTQINEWHINRLALEGKSVAPLYESGVYYKAEPPGEEEWLDIPSLYSQGFGDCEDLAAALCAEYRCMGVPAVCCIKHKRFETANGVVTMVHVMVLMPDGSIQDPSLALGMKGEYQ